jgi:hypothetical protein
MKFVELHKENVMPEKRAPNYFRISVVNNVYI